MRDSDIHGGMFHIHIQQRRKSVVEWVGAKGNSWSGLFRSEEVVGRMEGFEVAFSTLLSR